MILGFLVFLISIAFVAVILIFYGILFIPFVIIASIIYLLCKLDILPKEWINFNDKDKK